MVDYTYILDRDGTYSVCRLDFTFTMRKYSLRCHRCTWSWLITGRDEEIYFTPWHSVKVIVHGVLGSPRPAYQLVEAPKRKGGVGRINRSDTGAVHGHAGVREVGVATMIE